MTFSRFVVFVVVLAAVCTALNWMTRRALEPSKPAPPSAVNQLLSSREEMLRAVRTMGAEGW